MKVPSLKILLFSMLVSLFFLNPVYAGYTVDFNPDTDRMSITLTDGEDISIGKHPTTGGLAVNGICTGVLASQVKELLIYGDDGDNRIDLRNMHPSDFPELYTDPTSELPNTEIHAGGGDDTVYGGDLGTTILGGEGDDKLVGGDNQDRFFGGPGSDILMGGGNDDKLEGDGGEDHINGEGGDDYMGGGADDDFMDGGTGSDSMYGDEGDDRMRADEDDKCVDGGPGQDTIIIGEEETVEKRLTILTIDPVNSIESSSASYFHISDSSGIDSLSFAAFGSGICLDLNLFNSPQIYTANNDTLSLYGIFEYFTGTPYNDVIHIDPDPDFPRYVDGGGSNGADTLLVDGMGKDTNDDGSTITIQDYQPITYENIDHVVITNITGLNNKNIISPNAYRLFQNYPNPFNPITTIHYALPEPSVVQISVFNLNGRLIEYLFSGKKQTGFHSILWDASSLSSGTYLIRMKANSYTKIQKCILLK